MRGRLQADMFWIPASRDHYEPNKETEGGRGFLAVAFIMHIEEERNERVCNLKLSLHIAEDA
jgi:hypothetical protein